MVWFLAYGLSLEASGSWGLSASLSLPQATVEEAQTEKGIYSVVRFDGVKHGYTQEVGLPQLPALREMIEVPRGAQVSWKLEGAQFEELGVSAPVIPKQPPVPKSGPRPPFTIKESFYQQDAYWPSQFVKLTKVGISHGHELWLLEVFPVAYNPAKGSLKVLREARIEVEFSGGQGFIEDPTPYGQFVQRVAWNRQPSKAVPPLEIGYLIIVPDQYADVIAPLADWKRQKGFRVKVARTSETGSDASSIQAYIQNVYNTWEYPLQFVLLVGDVADIPNWPGDYANTDLYYGCVDGTDYIPDVWVGRLSVSNATELATVVNKILNYERVENWPNLTWAKRAYFMASDDPWYHDVAESTHAYSMRKARAYGMECDSLWYYYGTGTPIDQALNEGRSQATYSGHGYEQGWAGPPFDINGVYNLNNQGMLPLVQSYACLTGSYAAYDECFMEAWLRAPGGAIAAWGSSVTSYWEEDDTLQRRVYDWLFDSSVTWIKGFLDGGMYMMLVQFGNTSTVHRYFEQYNLFGDPSVDLFTLEPIDMTVTYGPVPPGPSTMTVHVEDPSGPLKDALVAVWQRDADTAALLGVAYTDAAGDAYVSVSPLRVDTVFVTVTAHNHKPHMGYTFVIANQAWVAPINRTYDDSQGNGDGIPNSGELLGIHYDFANLGSQDASSVVAKFRSSSGDIQIIDSVVNVGNVLAGDTVSPADSFWVRIITPNLPDQFAIPCTVAVSSTDTTWLYPQSIVIGAPVMDLVSVRILDSDQSRPNGRLDPGETVHMQIELKNIGHGHAYGVVGVLSESDPYITISDDQGAWGDILVDSAAFNTGDDFIVSADPNTPLEDTVLFTLITTTSDGYVDTLQFQIVVGTVTSEDPTGPDEYGYYAYDMTDTLYTECPSYRWNDISTVGTPLSLGDDDVITLPLPFTFKFYGVDYDSVTICSNGFFVMGTSTFDNFSNDSLPTSAVSNIIAGLWDDLSPNQQGAVYYYYDDVNHEFVVQWDSVPHYFTTTNNTFQIVLSDPAYNPTRTGDGEIFVYYKSADNISEATVGIQGNTTTYAICYTYNGWYDRTAAQITPPFAVKFTTDTPATMGTGESAGLPKRPEFAFLGRNFGSGPFGFTLAVPKSSVVSLKVFDASGRLVETILSERLDPGVYHVYWTPRVASGVYLVRAQVGKWALTRKVVITGKNARR